MRKSNLKQFNTIVAGDMSATSITSPVTNIEFLDNIGIQLNWTGSPTGTFEIQVSSDYNQDTNGNILNTGNWVPLSLSPAPSTTLGSPIYVNINQMSAPWIRIVYTKGSGTGSLDAWLSAKMI